MKLHFHPFTLQLQHTFAISHSQRDTQETLVVELSDGPHRGFGEAAATSYYGITVAGMMEDLEKIRPTIEAGAGLSPEALWEQCAPLLPHNRFALCALDMAMHDLQGKRKGLPLHQLWELDTRFTPLTNYTIGLDSVENMVKKMLSFPWPLYKIKLGTKEDLKIVRELRQHTDALFRVDANGAWTVEETLRYSRTLRELRVEFIEQPLPAADWQGMQRLYKKTTLPLIADESCQTEADVASCQGLFDGINIKLPKCGGLTPALRMIRQARTLGLKVMAGCMTESSVGISATAQLLPLLDYADLDGALLLKQDIAEGVYFEQGKARYPDRAGTGAGLLPHADKLKTKD